MKIIMWKGRGRDKNERVREHRFYPPDYILIKEESTMKNQKLTRQVSVLFSQQDYLYMAEIVKKEYGLPLSAYVRGLVRKPQPLNRFVNH